jgi:hypothetical protein
MRRTACLSAHPAVFAAALAFLAFVISAAPGVSGAASSEPGSKGSCRVSKVDRAEARIKELHTKLGITPAQEEAWNKIADVMRENSKTMESFISERKEKSGAMSAVEDLKSYGAIVEAHADGIRKFIAAFEPLYAGMSEEQKKTADTVFSHPGRRHHHDHAKAKSE